MQIRNQFVPSLLMAALLLVASGIGCDQKEGAIPDTAEARLQETTETLPAETSFVYVISDLAGFRKQAQQSKATIERLFPLDRLLQRAKDSPAGSKFFGDEGLKVFKKKFWKESGIAPDSGFALGMVDYNTVMLTYVADKKKFEKDLLSDLETDKQPTSKSIADKSVKTVETDKGTALWNYRGKLATVVFPEGDEAAPQDATTPPTSETFEKIVKTKSEDSLYATNGFEKFRKAAGQRNALGFAHLAPHIKRGMLEGENSEATEQYAKNVEQSLDGFGFLVETKQDRIKTRLWIGLTDTGQTYFKELFSSPVTAEWANYTTTDTLVGLRSAGNWKNLWNSLTEAMSDSERKEMKKNLADAKKQTGIDIQNEIIDNLDGQAGILVYGIGGKATPRMLGSPSRILENLEAMYVMKFGDADTLDKLAKKADEASKENIALRPVKVDGEKTGIKAVDLTVPEGGMFEMMLRNSQAGSMAGNEAPIRFYVHEDTLALATTAIAEEKINRMFTGDGSEPITDSSNLDLGAKFAKQEQMTGLYLNFVRFREIFGGQIPPIGAIQKPLRALQEGLLASEQADQGAWLDLTIDLMPADTQKGESTD